MLMKKIRKDVRSNKIISDNFIKWFLTARFHNRVFKMLLIYASISKIMIINKPWHPTN